MNDNDIMKLINNIIKIENKILGEILNFSKIDCIKISSKYSDIKIPFYKIKIDNYIVSKNNPYRVYYKCITCDTINISNLANLNRKINKNAVLCPTCTNHGEAKINNKLIKLSNKEKISSNQQEFDNMDSDFIEKYYTVHLTKDEFDYLKSKIISFQNDKFKYIDNFIYCPTFKINNRTKFTPMFYDKIRDVFEKPIYIKFKCEKCMNEFINRDLYVQKNKIKLYCRTCTFCNNTFKIRKTKNINDEIISYQSKHELKFINFCNDNNILVRNGPIIEYEWNNLKKKYIVDFYIPKLNWLIELEDNHIWHKNQVINGIWDCKVASVNKLINDKIYNNFLLIFPKNYQANINFILNKI